MLLLFLHEYIAKSIEVAKEMGGGSNTERKFKETGSDTHGVG